MRSHLAITSALAAALLSGAVTAGTAAQADFEAAGSDLDRLALRAREPGRGVSAIQPLLTGWMGGLSAEISEARPKVGAPGAIMRKGKLGTAPIGLAWVQLNSIGGGPAPSPAKLAAPSPVLVIREGRLTLKQLVDEAEEQFPEAFERSADGAIAVWPILIWSDAQLVLEKSDRLLLSGSTGSFIINTGLLRMDDAIVSAGAGAPAEMPEFHPFIATVFTGALQAYDSEFSGLGFAGSPGTLGLVIAGSPMSIKRDMTVLSGNAFRDIGGIDVRNSREIEISGNRFVASRFASLRLEGVSKAQIEANVIADSIGTFAIDVSGNSHDVDVTRNIVLSGSGDGIHVGDGAYAIRLADNLASGQSKDGISIERAGCLIIERNIAIGNGSNGISIRRSAEVSLNGNELIRNHQAGVFLRTQPEAAVTRLEDNIFAENGSGVRGQASSRLEIANNDFTGQLPIIVSGDLSGTLRQFLDSDRDDGLVALPAAAWASAADDVRRLTQPAATLPCKFGS
jgi:Periplasmic copper-binding protein (NosD)